MILRYYKVIRYDQAPVVERLKRGTHWINLYPVHNAVCFPYTHLIPIHYDLFCGQYYQTFEKLGPRDKKFMTRYNMNRW